LWGAEKKKEGEGKPAMREKEGESTALFFSAGEKAKGRFGGKKRGKKKSCETRIAEGGM